MQAHHTSDIDYDHLKNSHTSTTDEMAAGETWNVIIDWTGRHVEGALLKLPRTPGRYGPDPVF
jgi:hypothetical protein